MDELMLRFSRFFIRIGPPLLPLVGGAVSLQRDVLEHNMDGLINASFVFAEGFEGRFVGQKEHRGRDVTESLELGWELLRPFPPGELRRLTEEQIARHLSSPGEEEGRAHGED